MFAAATREWFEREKGEPTEAQRRGWEAIARGGHVLIHAPTGSGKTLAAFLHAIDRLAREPEPGRLRVLYVSPLKALAADVEKNLEEPLRGLGAPLTVALRTGDTPAKARRAFVKTPADILVTTPESLFLLLTSRAREALVSVDTVIVDEVHALAGSKRGAHLALSLERLDARLKKPAQRIGLTATAAPLDEIARFLGGAAKVEVVSARSPRALEVHVAEPVADAVGPLLELILAHRSTIVFANSRMTAERLAARLNERHAGGGGAGAGGDGPPRSSGETIPAGEPFEAWSDAVLDADADFVTEPTDRDDPAIWLFTSGSTGKPKANVHLHHDFAYNTELFAKRTIGMRESDVTLSVPKLFFGYATGTNLWFPFAVGATTALFKERATAESVFANIERFKPTVLTSVPTMINAMLAAPEEHKRSLASLRFLFSAGEALPEELYRRWKETYGVEIYDGIGSAELFHIYITNRPGDVKPGTLGKIVEGYEARIVRPDGTDAPDGEVGTLWVKGDSAAVYYWQDQEKTKQVFKGGDWVASGDLFTRDEQGYFTYSGRGDDMLKVGGVWVAPIEIENCLLQHEGVLECCVLGYDDEGLVKPLAVVVPRRGKEPSANELQEFVKKRLLPYKYPRKVVFRAEPLPKNDRGKTDRKSLKEALARGEL